MNHIDLLHIHMIKNKNTIKNKTILITFSIILLLLVTFEIISYKSFIQKFYSSFNSYDFATASSMVSSKENRNPIIKSLIKKDSSLFFSNKLDNMYMQIQTSELSSNDAILILDEIRDYDVLDTKNYKITDKINFLNEYINALSLFENKTYKEAFTAFNSLEESPFDESKSSKHINEYILTCRSNIKTSTYTEISTLCNINYYTKALELLDSNLSYFENDEEYIDKIDQIMVEKQAFLAASNIKNNIKESSLNVSSIQSSTPYLITVDISSQKTTVYTGKKNNWNSIKSFICSTGIKGQSTPKGAFIIQQKGEWFFSSKYGQGGKYWIQFKGNYLFHSVPFNADQSKVLDNTLGTPASHGCIRLAEENSKWLYDNIPAGTKLIIK